MPKSNIKTVKAWAILSIRKKDIADIVFTSKKEAESHLLYTIEKLKPYYLGIPSLVISAVYQKYKIIPCTITYALPLSVKKKSK